MTHNSKETTLKGLFWNAADRFGNQVVVTVVGIFTARLLFPQDFAVVAALGIFSVLATALVDSGLATSLVRSKDVSKVDYSTMFGFNLLVSIVIYLLLFVFAPYIEQYYSYPNLALYARVLFLQILVHALGIVQNVQLLREFKFNIIARVNLFSVLISGVMAIVCAIAGFGAWALIIQPLLFSLVRTIFFWYWGNWRLDLVFSYNSLKSHLGFSIMFMLSNLLNKVLSPLYTSVIGKNDTKAMTGFYYQANKWGETPNLLISSIIQGTTLSTLAPFQNDYPRFLNACRKTMATLGFVLFPVSFCAIAIAEPAFVSVLGERYHSSVVFFQLLTFAGLFMSLADLNVSFLNIKGKSNYALSLEIFKFLVAVIVLFFTYNKGVLQIIYGQVIVRIIFYILVTVLSRKIYGYHLFSQLQDIMPSFIISLLCALVAYLPLYFGLPIVNGLLFIIQGLIFILLYVGANHVMQTPIWVELLQVIKSKFTK